jgi:hypothetical protein
MLRWKNQTISFFHAPFDTVASEIKELGKFYETIRNDFLRICQNKNNRSSMLIRSIKLHSVFLNIYACYILALSPSVDLTPPAESEMVFRTTYIILHSFTVELK